MAHLHCMDPTLLSDKFAALVDSLPRRHTSALVQLQTGHTLLNHHLARIGKTPSPACARCGARYETVHHFALIFPAYQKERFILRRNIGRRKMNLSSLLTDRSTMKELLRFLAHTWCLTQVFGDLTPPPPPRLPHPLPSMAWIHNVSIFFPNFCFYFIPLLFPLFFATHTIQL